MTAPAAYSRTVKRAVDAINANPAHDFTATDLADAADALSRLDDGTATTTDRAIAAIFDRHCSNEWHRVNTQVDRWQADRCVVCGNPGGPECVRCAIDHDTDMTRRADR